MAMRSPCRLPWRTAFIWLALCALVLGLAAAGPPLLAAGTNDAPAQPQPPPAAQESFGQYLADHQADLTPFFEKNSDELLKQAVPLLMGLTGWIMLFTLLAAWVLDVLISRGFASFFAPAFAKIKQSVIYATGRLVLSVALTVLMSLAMIFSLSLPNAGIVLICVTVLFLLLALAVQIVWVTYLYRTNLPVSFLFYLAIMVAHTLVGLLISAPVIGARASVMVTDFVDKTLTPKLQGEVDSTKQQLATVAAARDDAKAKVDTAQNQIAQAQVQQEQMSKEIEEKKHSEVYVFSQIAKVHAQGDLNSARDQLTDFLAKFPSGSLIDQARTQLAQVNSELAIQEAQKKQAEADAAAAAAAARADLLARAAQGQVTLSEARQALIGKSRDEVKDLFGDPTETASDRWGYGQQMIVNPLTDQKFGLTVYFLEGVVQSVDYYYGKGPAR